MWHVIRQAQNTAKLRTMMDQRPGRWSDVVQMLYKCFVHAGITLLNQADNLFLIFHPSRKEHTVLVILVQIVWGSV